MRFSHLLIAVAAAASLVACSSEKHPADLVIRVTVTAEAKDEVVGVLDGVAKGRGWVKTPAAPGLDEIARRKVLFFSYGRRSKEMLITISDIKTEAEVEVHAFFETSSPGLVEGAADDFAIHVAAVSGVSSVYKQRAGER